MGAPPGGSGSPPPAAAPGVLPRGVHVGYSLGSLATGAFGTVPGLLLLPYLTDTLGVAAGMAALLVLLPKAWDVLVNPVAGRISDRTRSRWGARRPYLLVGGLALAGLFAVDLRRAVRRRTRPPPRTWRSPSWPPPPRSRSSRCRTWRCRPS